MKSILNFRTFTHLKTKDNSKIQDDKLFRSAAPEKGTNEDLKKLHALKIDTIIDFRDEHEKQPMLEEKFNEQFHRKSAAINVANFFNRKDFKNITAINDESINSYYYNIYEALPMHFHHQYQTLFAGTNQGQTMLFHCSAGKDRTGFAAYLILSALNVHHDDIMHDYLVSNDVAHQLYQSLKQGNKEIFPEHLPDATIQALFGVKEEYLNSSIQVIKQSYQSIEHYLTEALFADINSIRKHYLA